MTKTEFLKILEEVQWAITKINQSILKNLSNDREVPISEQKKLLEQKKYSPCENLNKEDLIATVDCEWAKNNKIKVEWDDPETEDERLKIINKINRSIQEAIDKGEALPDTPNYFPKAKLKYSLIPEYPVYFDFGNDDDGHHIGFFFDNEILYKLFLQENDIINSIDRIYVRWNKTVLEYTSEKQSKEYKEYSDCFIFWFDDKDINIKDVDSLVDEHNEEYSEVSEIPVVSQQKVSGNVDKELELEKENKELKYLNRVAINKVKRLSAKKNRFSLSSLSDKDLELIVDRCRKINKKINYAKVGRELGRNAKTVKSEIHRRNMGWLENSPD